MKIEFLDPAECTEAVVTRGLFRRKAAWLTWCETSPGSGGFCWRYESTNRCANYDLSVALDRARTKELERAQDEAEWIIVPTRRAKVAR